MVLISGQKWDGILDSSHDSHHEVKIGSERSFGVVFAIFFAILALLPILSSGSVHLALLVLSGVMLVLGLFFPATLKYPNKLWFKFGMLLGNIVSPVSMGLVYLVAFIPIGLLFKLLGKDPLQRGINSDASSYWIRRETKMESMKRQF